MDVVIILVCFTWGCCHVRPSAADLVMSLKLFHQKPFIYTKKPLSIYLGNFSSLEWDFDARHSREVELCSSDTRLIRAKCDKKWLLVWIRGFWIAVDWEFGRLRAVFQGTVHIYLVWCSNHIRLQFCESGLFSAVLLMFDFWWYSGFFSMFLNINLSDQLRRINKFLLCVCVLHVL